MTQHDDRRAAPGEHEHGKPGDDRGIREPGQHGRAGRHHGHDGSHARPHAHSHAHAPGHEPPGPTPHDATPPVRRRFALRENSWQERLAGFALMTAIVPLAVLGYLIICWVGFAGRTERGRAGVRALDHFVNAAVFNGLAWESVSSHAWRARHDKRWARFVIWLTDRFQPGHCQRANKREQPVIDLVLRKGLQKRTIGAKDGRPD